MQGNAAADELAKQGALQHAAYGDTGYILHDAKKIACVVQKMQAHIWELYLQAATEDVQAADAIDSSIAAHCAEAAAHPYDDDYDYDPFEPQCNHEQVPSAHQGYLDADMADRTITSVPSVSDNVEGLTLQQRFPDYGWTEACGQPDEGLQIILPSSDVLLNLHRAGKQTVPNLASPKLVCKDGAPKQSMHKQFYIPPHWWEPVAWWIQHTKWSVHGIKGRNGCFNRQAHRCTWAEMCILFQCVTGFRFPPAALDLRSQETVFKNMVQRILRQSKYCVYGVDTNYNDVWGNGNGIASAKPILGHPRTGLCRRPIVSNQLWTGVVQALVSAHEQGNAFDTFGVGYNVKIHHLHSIRFIPSATHQLHLQAETREYEAKEVSSDLNAFVQVSITACKGPCHFGHTTTSGRRGGKVSWHSNPIVSYWPGKVPGGVTLCSMCYQIGNRAAARKTPARMPRHFKEVNGTCPPPGTTLQHSSSTSTVGVINKPPAGPLVPEAVVLRVGPPVLINMPTPPVDARPPSLCIKPAANRAWLDTQPSLSPAHGQQRRLNDHGSEFSLTPSAHFKGCNIEGMPDMHEARHNSAHPDATPSVFKAFPTQTLRKAHEHGLHQPQSFLEVTNGRVHEFFNNLEQRRNDGGSSEWGTFLTCKGTKRECDVAHSGSAIGMHHFTKAQEDSFLTKRRKLHSTPASLRICSSRLPLGVTILRSEIEDSFLAKRRKLHSTPSSVRAPCNQFASSSVDVDMSQRDNTLSTNAPT